MILREFSSLLSFVLRSSSSGFDFLITISDSASSLSESTKLRFLPCPQAEYILVYDIRFVIHFDDHVHFCGLASLLVLSSAFLDTGKQ